MNVCRLISHEHFQYISVQRGVQIVTQRVVLHVRRMKLAQPHRYALLQHFHTVCKATNINVCGRNAWVVPNVIIVVHSHRAR